MPASDNVQFHRRRLPHYRLDGSTYFVTWRLGPGKPELSPGEREIVCSTIRHFEGQRYHLAAFVVMNDHVHVLLTPAAGYELSDIVHSWKSFSSLAIHKSRGQHGRLWQDEYFDRVVRSDDEFLEKVNYILANPFNRWPDISEYPWTRTSGQE